MEFESDKYGEFIENITIREIILNSLETIYHSDDVDDSDKIKVSINHEVDEYVRNQDTYVVPIKFEVLAKVDDNNLNLLFSIKFSYLAIYKIPTDFNCEEQYIKWFADKNVPLNVWPYARELVSNMTYRMGLPPLTIPMLKVVG